MFKQLTRFSLKNGAVILIAMLMVIAGGIYSYIKIPNSDYPSVDVPWVHLDINYPGATPQQVYEDIGKVLEPKLRAIDGTQNLYSFSSTGHQEFDLEVSMDRKNKDVDRDIQDIVNQVKLPDNAQKPNITNSTISGDAIYIFSVSADHASLQGVQTYVQNTLQPQLVSITGVGNVRINGIGTKNIYVDLNTQKMKSVGVTWQQVQQALIANNFSSPIGNLNSNQTSMPIVVGNHLSSLKDIENVPIVVLKQNTSGIHDAFRSVQNGFGAMAGAMGHLGQNEGVLQAEIQYMEIIQSLSATLMADNLKLQTQSAMNVLHPSPQSAQDVAALKPKIQAEQAEILALQHQLASLRSALGFPKADSVGSGQGVQSVTPTIAASVLRLGDIANVVYQDDPNNGTITRTNGKPGVVVRIIPATNANTIQVVHDVKDALTKAAMPTGYHWSELSNGADHVKQSVDGMLREAIFGALLATVVTLLFLRDLRATIVALCSIPLSIFAAVIVMNQLGYSLNMLTLSGVAVAVGRVVDDSIVVIENTYRRLRSRTVNRDVALVEDATAEVGSAITSSTITTVAVFLPMTVVPGIVGHVFAPFAWTVIIALAFSLLVALMVVPLVAKWTLLRVTPVEHKESPLQRVYRQSLGWSLNHKWIVVLLSLLLLAESGFAATRLGISFLPSDRVNMFVIDASMPIASNMQAANNVATQIEQRLSHDNGVKSTQSFISAGDASLYVTIKDSVRNSDAFSQHLRQLVQSVTGAHRVTVSGKSGIGDSTVHLMLEGADYNQLKTVAGHAAQALSKIRGLTDVSTSVQANMPQVQVDVDANAAAAYGLDPMQVGSMVRNMVNGDTATTANYLGQDTDIKMVLGDGHVLSTQSLGDQTLSSPTGSQVRLNQIAKLSVVNGPTTISRLNQQQFIQVTGTIVATNQGAVTSQVNQAVSALHLPAGISFHQEGASQDMNSGFKNIALAMLASFFLVLVVMLVAFGGWTAPLSIVFALPFAVVGGFNGLWITQQPLGIPGMIGFMMLIGIIVTNAIVLMDRVERQIKQGMGVREALMEAGSVRLRPILMTATATIGALIPLTLTTDVGIISKTLAIVVIGGLVTSTLLTLFIVPIMYEWFSRIKLRVVNRRVRVSSFEAVAVTSEGR